MIDFTASEIATYYRTRVPKLKQTRAQEWRGPCPVHHGSDNNFAVNHQTGTAFCHSQCNTGWNIVSLERELYGGTLAEATQRASELVGRDRKKPTSHRGTLEATYDYTDADGSLLFQVLRFANPKRFYQRR